MNNTLALALALALAGCGGAVAPAQADSAPAPCDSCPQLKPPCARLAAYSAALERAGCEPFYDIADALAAGDVASCTSLAASFDACAADAQCSSDASYALLAACGCSDEASCPGPRWAL